MGDFYHRGDKEMSFHEGQPESHTLVFDLEKTMRSGPRVPWQA